MLRQLASQIVYTYAWIVALEPFFDTKLESLEELSN